MTYKCLYTEKQVMLNKGDNKRETKGTDAERGTYLISLRKTTRNKRQDGAFAFRYTGGQDQGVRLGGVSKEGSDTAGMNRRMINVPKTATRSKVHTSRGWKFLDVT